MTVISRICRLPTKVTSRFARRRSSSPLCVRRLLLKFLNPKSNWSDPRARQVSRLWDLKLLNPLVADIGDVEMAVAVAGHAVRVRELTGVTAGASEAEQEFAVGGEALHAVVQVWNKLWRSPSLVGYDHPTSQILRLTTDDAMSTLELRREIKKVIDRLPPERLASLADYVDFLNRPPLVRHVKAAEKAIAVGKGVNWRKVRSDV